MNTAISQNQNFSRNVSRIRKIFLVGIILNLVYLIVESVFGICYHSSGLLSDAIQNLCDVAGMTIVLAAYRLADPGGTYRFNYRYKRKTIMFVALITLVVGVFITYIIFGAVRQIQSPRILNGRVITIVAAVGVLVNSITAILFLRTYRRRPRGGKVFRHMLADALVSLTVLISGIVMLVNKWYAMDAIIGLAIILATVFALWELLRHCVWTVLDGVPDDVHYERLVQVFYEADGVEEVHHLHVWSVGAWENVLTAKVQVQDVAKADSIREILYARLKQEGISDVTLEFENSSFPSGTRPEPDSME